MIIFVYHNYFSCIDYMPESLLTWNFGDEAVDFIILFLCLLGASSVMDAILNNGIDFGILKILGEVFVCPFHWLYGTHRHFKSNVRALTKPHSIARKA
jgi:hypothetical protein